MQFRPNGEKLFSRRVRQPGNHRVRWGLGNGRKDHAVVLESYQWTPYPGQLRLQVLSHLASGAQMGKYWRWATTANAVETYWRGLLSQDTSPMRSVRMKGDRRRYSPPRPEAGRNDEAQTRSPSMSATPPRPPSIRSSRQAQSTTRCYAPSTMHSIR